MTLDPAIVSRVQARVGVPVDGDVGALTLDAVDRALSNFQTSGNPIFQTVSGKSEPKITPEFSTVATALIVQFEGLDQPGKWPGASSGITLGRGYDLGFTTPVEFQRDWTGHLTPAQITRLRTSLGRSGSAAAHLASEFRDIVITAGAADAVFSTATLPKYSRAALTTFPGLDLVDVRIRAALTSLVFNRGTSLDADDPRRREMRTVRDLITTLANPKLTAGIPAEHAAMIVREIAGQLRAMKRLWQGQGLDGLLRRRDAEADLVESSLVT